jgi:hypothetical protein
MTIMSIRLPILLHARLKGSAERRRTSVAQLLRELLEAGLNRQENGTGDPVTMDDLRKFAATWERLIVAIFATEQMVVRCLDPHRTMLPMAGQKAIELAAEMLGTSRPKAAPRAPST